MNIGEAICCQWLRHVKGCEFVQYNLKTPDVQGEIDVIGINLKDRPRTVYACEAAIHLVTGLQYVWDKRPDNVPRLIAKFRKDIEYLRKAFPVPEYRHVFMLWSPIVKNQRAGSKYNQMDDAHKIVSDVEAAVGVRIDLKINESVQQALHDLRIAARAETRELDSSVMRYLQVEERLSAHLARCPK